jgi:hypothetical protein
LFITSFMLLEHYHNQPIGSYSFFASSIACIVVAALTAAVSQATAVDAFVLIDVTLLWVSVLLCSKRCVLANG